METATSLFTRAKKVITFEPIRHKLLQKKIDSFEPKVVFKKTFKEYELRTATTPEDLEQILRLRHDIFVKDLGRKKQSLDVDFDRYDLLGDHIMIIDKNNNQVVGTYRLISSHFSDKFYSQNEFNLSELIQSEDPIIELGRACIHKEFRKGIILHLIWRGLAHYINMVNARYIFGCSSVFTVDIPAVREILNHFPETAWGTEFQISPTKKYRFPVDFEVFPGEEISAESAALVPNLLKSYLKVGAKIYGQPALDVDFRCSDILTVLDLKEMVPKYYKKYFSDLDADK